MAFAELLGQKAEMHALEERLGDDSVPEGEHEAMLVRYAELQEQLPARRRLQHRPAHRHRAARPRLQPGRLRQADRDVLGRLADAHRARQAAARPARAAAARRADQPPRSRRAQLARGVPLDLPARGDPRLARPLLPRRGRHPHHRPQPAHADRLRRQLQQVRRASATRCSNGCARPSAIRTKRSRGSRCSSTASATRRPRRRRCRAGSRCSRRWCRSRCRPSASGSASPSRRRRRAAAPSSS